MKGKISNYSRRLPIWYRREKKEVVEITHSFLLKTNYKIKNNEYKTVI